MPNAPWSAEKSRRIEKRIVIEGELVLETPAHFGSGETGDVTDMPLLVAPDDGKTPLLTGASLAGALRSYLRSRQFGWHAALPPEPGEKGRSASLEKERRSAAVRLFGGFRMDDDGLQSPLIVDDAYGNIDQPGAKVEMRAGVRINPKTRTAMDNFLYNAEFWPTGLKFHLRFELLISRGQDEQALRSDLATTLEGLEKGDISLGARRRRGFGRCKVAAWTVTEFNLTQADGLLAWLEGSAVNVKKGASIAALLGAQISSDQRRTLKLEAELALVDSLLIRSSTGQAGTADFVHLHSYRPGRDSVPVISGTSLAGALRARALRIANTLKIADGSSFIDSLFGRQMDQDSEQPEASRLWVEESIIENAYQPGKEPVQNRIKINRFTGGAYEFALYSEQPVFQKVKTAVRLVVQLVEPQDAQIGMLLLLLKDLWTSDLPLGGESSVGRGRLAGQSAQLELSGPENKQIWLMKKQDEPGQIVFEQGNPDELEGYVQALRKLEEVAHV